MTDILASMHPGWAALAYLCGIYLLGSLLGGVDE